MRNLIINRLMYDVECEEGSKYGADIKFEKGINIIYGPNSVGKSSIIIGIIYALGMEKSLGIFSSKQNPFKPEFYDKIENKKIIESKVYLEISNGNQTVTICRPILGKTDVCSLNNSSLEDTFNKRFIDAKELIADGTGVMSEDGLQRYLFDFLEWSLVEVPSYEGEKKKLYLENLAPLFFIEQKAGWSQIQARQINRYGIKDVKKIVFEYLMGLDKFKVHLLELEKREIREKILSLQTDLENKEQNLLVQANAFVDDNKELFVERPGWERKTLKSAIKQLEKEIADMLDKVNKLSEQKEEIVSVELNSKDKLREVSNLRRLAADKVNILTREIISYTNYIKTIEINRLKNLQLKKIGELGTKLNIATCPICESPLNESEDGCCQLCKEDIKKISTPEENMAFLEDEKSSFLRILKKKEFDLEKAKQQYEELVNKEHELTEKLDFQLKTYLGKNPEKIREIQIEIDSLFNDLQKYKYVLNQWKGLNSQRIKIQLELKNENNLKDTIRKYEQSKQDMEILSEVLSNFRNNEIQLRLFKDKPKLADELKLDQIENYGPYLDSYDLYNISSSSDNIRIIIGYYIALLQTSLNLNYSSIKFPNLLIFDEPKQQNLDDVDFDNLLSILGKLKKESYQVILTTFNNRNRQNIGKYIKKEMFSGDDYLLKQIS